MLTLSDWIEIVGIIVSIVIGIIGIKCLSKANQIKAKSINGSTINQAETLIVNNGIDKYAVIKLAKDTTKEELQLITKELEATTLDITKIKKELSSLPRFHVVKEFPKEMKEGDIYFTIE